MKKKLIIMSTILLISIAVAGNTLAWFSASSNNSETIGIATIDVAVVEKGSTSLSNIKTHNYNKDIKVENFGTGETYIRVRLIPQWSDHNLPVSNVDIILNNRDWTSRQDDGYYYFKYYLNENQTTSQLVESINFKNLPPEYDGKDFTLKAVAEGVQNNKKALEAVWGIDTLPFTPNKPWTP